MDKYEWRDAQHFRTQISDSQYYSLIPRVLIGIMERLENISWHLYQILEQPEKYSVTMAPPVDLSPERIRYLQEKFGGKEPEAPEITG